MYINIHIFVVQYDLRSTHEFSLCLYVYLVISGPIYHIIHLCAILVGHTIKVE